MTLARIVFIVVVTAALALSENALNLETKISDLLIDLRAAPDASRQVVIVGIDDDDHQTIFRGSSPLDPAGISALVDAISRGGALSLGIDVLTSGENGKRYTPAASSIPIVWAAALERDAAGRPVRVDEPLGGQPLPANIRSGVPETILEGGLHRQYEREIEVRGSRYPTFPWQVYAAAHPGEAALRDREGPLYIAFADEPQFRDPTPIGARQVLDASPEELAELFAGKIVLLGAMYADARDKKKVPFGLFSEGEINGVELLATIVETEMGGPLKPLPQWLKVAISVVMLFLFTLNFHIYGVNRWSLGIALAVGLVVAGLLSLLWHYSFWGFPLLAAMMVYGIGICLVDIVIDKWKETFGKLATGERV